MTVAARSDNDPALPAKRAVVRMRGREDVVAGTYVHEGEALTTGWHSHDLHQLEYAVRGLVEVEDATGRHLFAPQQAAWIPAGVEHQSVIHTSVRTISVFFEPGLVHDAHRRVRVLAVRPLVREMILHAVRWPVDRRDRDIAADRFFTAMADVVKDSFDGERPLVLPTSMHPVLVAVGDHVRDHLGEITVPRLSRAVGVSERTLRRLVRSELGLSCREYILQARLLTAMVLLARPGQTVLGAASAVGFSSSSAFARVFIERCGESPSAYGRRVQGGGQLDRHNLSGH